MLAAIFNAIDFKDPEGSLRKIRASLATRSPHEHEFIRRDGWWCVCGEAFKPEDDSNA